MEISLPFINRTRIIQGSCRKIAATVFSVKSASYCSSAYFSNNRRIRSPWSIRVSFAASYLVAVHWSMRLRSFSRSRSCSPSSLRMPLYSILLSADSGIGAAFSLCSISFCFIHRCASVMHSKSASSARNSFASHFPHIQATGFRVLLLI